MAGLSKGMTGDQVQVTLGTQAKNAHKALKDALDGHDFLQGLSNQELLADYGISNADADKLRAGMSALNDLWRIYRGQDALAAPRDFRTDTKPIMGLGF
jgi:hypothetical protein